MKRIRKILRLINFLLFLCDFRLLSQIPGQKRRFFEKKNNRGPGMLDMCMRMTSHGGKNGPISDIRFWAGLKISFSDYSGLISCLAGHDALLFDNYLYQIGIRNDISFISRFSEK